MPSATAQVNQVKPETENGPRRFHLLSKPSGSACNIDCQYCFFLSKEALYPGERQRMSDETLEEYIRQLLESHDTPSVTVAWQGGEPTLMGLAFFERAMELVEKHKRIEQRVQHTFQTNGIALDDDWAAFFKQHGVLVGLSVDGPRDLHDRYRVTRGGKGTFDHVMRGLSFLRKHGVEYNILCTVNAANQHHGRRVYTFFRDELAADWIQFIPILERATPDTLPLANLGWNDTSGHGRMLYTQSGTVVTNRSVGGRQYGQFLVDIFEEWIRRDVGKVFVQLFDVTLEAYFGRYTLCIHSPTCGLGPTIEHNGDLYSCDHYVEPDYLLGNIHEEHMLDLVASPQQQKFGLDKLDLLTSQCKACEVKELCNGGCPKDRFAVSRDGEPGHNYLCAGLELFYKHTKQAMLRMVALLREGRPAAEIMEWVAAKDSKRAGDAPCSCRGGRKFKRCHGRPVEPPRLVSASVHAGG